VSLLHYKLSFLHYKLVLFLHHKLDFERCKTTHHYLDCYIVYVCKGT